jgi:phosphatidylglycerol:prolipoprotein diacylglycerol transferase
MFPIFNLGPLTLPTYPLLLLVALWSGMAVSARQASRLGLDGDHVYNAGLYGLIAGIIGARLWFVLSHWENYSSNLSQALSLSRSALSAGEGLIIAGLVILIYLQLAKVPLGQIFDALAPGLTVAIIIANVGAFLAGESLGSPSQVSWTVASANVPRHPFQLYQAIAGVGILLALYLLRRRRPWPGFRFWLFVSLYSGLRLFLEIFRDQPPIIGDGFLAVQLLALSAIVISLAVMASKFRSTPMKIEVETHEFVG